MMQTARDNPGVIAPPPLISLAALLLGLGLDRLAPIGFIETILPSTARVSLAVLIGMLAIWIARAALWHFAGRARRSIRASRSPRS